MKRKNNKKIIQSGIMILILILIGCGGSKKENSSGQHSTKTVDTKKPASQKTGKNTKQPDFKSEPLVSIELHSLVHDATYDAEAPVILKMELYSPRSFAMLNHNQYRNPEEAAIELPEAKVENSVQPWWQEITLTYTSADGSTGELEFSTGYPSQKDVLELGQGEVGSIEIIIRENSFPQAGKFNLKAAWNNKRYGLIESENLPITLKEKHLSDIDRNELQAKVLLATGENGPALQKIKKLAQANPDSYAIRYYLAEAFEKNNNFKEALSQYQHALTLFPRIKSDEPADPPVGLLIKIKELIKKLDQNQN